MANFSDLDAYAEALKKIDFDDVVMPYKNGRLVENVEIYNKVQKLLDCPELETAHQFLYDVDCDEISEEECEKIDKLYSLATERGFIEAEEPEGEEQKADECDAVVAANLAPAAPAVVPAAPAPTVPCSAFTIIYSAMKDGQIKTGECYSNSIDTRSAKADALSKLERAGYSNISILAIEAGDPDCAGACDNTYCKQPEVAQVPIGAPATEDDMLDGRVHNGHVEEADDREELSHGLDAAGIKASTANTAAQDAVAVTVKEKDDKEEAKDDGAEDKAADDKAEDKAEDADKADDAEDKADDKAEDKDDAADDKKDDGEDLDPAKKTALKDAYKKAFKAALAKCKFETSFEELDLQDKVKFFTELAKGWGDKEDPSKFMTDKEIDQLEKVVVKK